MKLLLSISTSCLLSVFILSCTTTKNNLAQRSLASDSTYPNVFEELTPKEARRLAEASRQASLHQDPSILRKAIIELGADVVEKVNPKNGITLLHMEVLRGNIETVEMIVQEFKVSPNISTFFYGTPMFLAASYGLPLMIRLLHRLGGNPNAQSSLKRTPISVASGDKLRHLSLSSYEGRVGLTTKKSSLMRGRVRAVQALLDVGAIPRTSEITKAQKWGRHEILELLENRRLRCF